MTGIGTRELPAASPLADRRYRRRSCRGASGSAERGPRRIHGFSLLEAMIALVVLSVGMLGIAALHGQSLAANRSAQLRTHAVNLAGDMADRIRVNRLGAAAYEGPAASNACDPQTGGGVDCTPADMAAHDLFVWQDRLETLLPNGAGSVNYDGAAEPPTYTIDVSWTEPGEGTLTHTLVIRVPEF